MTFKMTFLIIAILFELAGYGIHAQELGVNSELRGAPLHLLGASNHESRDGNYLQGADPFVFKAFDGKGYLYTTNRPGINIPVYKSADLINWMPLGDAMPKLPSWARAGKTWAPEVLGLESQKYIIYYTANDIESGKQCIGRAIAKDPAGPFVDQSQHPFQCNKETETSIDPSPFVDSDGKIYLLWKTKISTANGRDLTKIWIRPLTPDGQISQEKAIVLLINDLPWEGDHIEAPTLVHIHGKYVLFYSAGTSTSMGYSVSYAESDSILGPYNKVNMPIITGNSTLRGAGHQSLNQIGPNSFMVFYHSVHPERKKLARDHARYIEHSYICFDGIEPRAQSNNCKLP